MNQRHSAVKQVHIGAITVEKTAALAPMAGVSDRAFRELCRQFGACYAVGEMVSAKGLVLGSKKSAELLCHSETESPAAVQLFGDSPQTMAEAAVRALAYHPDLIDLNMGCPVPKIAGNGGGSALMKKPALAGEIIRAVKSVSPVPVTVKFRKGWDEHSVNAVAFAQMAEENGADAITIHGRTRAQMYAPPVDLEIIRAVKHAVSIPVIGNGDVDSPEAAKAMYEQTGCDLVMVGRGALGAPWLFAQIAAYLQSGVLLPAPPLEQRMEIMIQHVERIAAYKGEPVALREARKHCGWYMAGLRGAASLRRMATSLSSFSDLHVLAETALLHNA